MVNAITAFVTGLTVFYSGAAHFDTPIDDLIPTEWKCEDPNWVVPPTVQNLMYDGTIEVKCEFEAVSGGGFPQLQKYSESKIVKEANEIHAGPTEETYKGLPGVYFDATIIFGNATDTVTIRADHHVVTDGTTKAIYDIESTRISGTGMGAYLKSTFVGGEVTPLTQEGWYAATFTTRNRIEQPLFMPTSIFQMEVTRQIEEEIVKREEETITEIANNL